MSATLRLSAAVHAKPALWQADRLQSGLAVQASGHPALDAELPGGGWPLGVITEVLQPASLHAEWQLLLPALLQRLRQQPGALVLVGAPYWPYAPALQALALPARRLLAVTVHGHAQALWATEQALRCPEVAAVLVWQDGTVDMTSLRRLQLAAQGQASLLVLLRGQAQAQQASPAPLRLGLLSGLPRPGVTRMLGVSIHKRRGPPCLHTVWLPWQPAWQTGGASMAVPCMAQTESTHELVDSPEWLAR